MVIQFVSIKCPECGADLSIDKSREHAFCSYCGAKVIVHNDNEHIYRNIDEARLKEAETDRIIKLRQLELAEKANVSNKALIIGWLSATAILLLIGIIGMSIDNEGMGICMMLAMNVGLWGGIFIFAKEKNNKRVLAGSNEAVITRAMTGYIGKNHTSLEMLFRGAGFSNVTAVSLGDLNLFTQVKSGQVESITINGISDFEEGDIFPKTANVLITYHSR